MDVALIAKAGHAHTGVGRYTGALTPALQRLGHRVALTHPIVPVPTALTRLGQRVAGVDAAAFFNNYPVRARPPRADVAHVSSQNLATVLLLRRPRAPTVVTVHDIIPYMVRNDPALCTYRTLADRVFDLLALTGLKRAHGLIADSEYTRQALGQHLGIDTGRVRVVHLGIDQERFRPRPVTQELRDRFQLRQDRRYLIYVGSEDPRKDLGSLIDALAQIRQTAPDVELLKIGQAHFADERERLLARARTAGVGAAVHFLNDVSDADLPALYSLASVCVMPSLYEGFGFPVLEAMACGTPVVAADASSLPELVGDAGLLAPPRAPARLAAAVGQMLDVDGWSRDWRAAGLHRASLFTWDRTARQTAEVYEDVRHGTRSKSPPAQVRAPSAV
ncbi:MAG: glycosyltransferase family 4 protein [Chloroflexi bacterium]|nr:glycosyltransferase family 4 protein [Chloroflexota bacterium]